MVFKYFRISETLGHSKFASCQHPPGEFRGVGLRLLWLVQVPLTMMGTLLMDVQTTGPDGEATLAIEIWLREVWVNGDIRRWASGSKYLTNTV